MVDDSLRQREVEDRSEGTQFTRRTVMRTGAAGLGALGFGSGVGTTVADPSANVIATQLHTDGRWIKDDDDNRIRFRGVATADPGFYEMWHPKTALEVAEWAIDESRGWYPNLVRFPLTQYSVENLGFDRLIGDIVRPIVDLLAERGVYALIDYHIIRPYTKAATIDAGGYDVYPDELLRTFWNRVTPEFAADENVVFELFNEPTYPLRWSDYGENVETKEDEWLLWRDTAQPWVDVIREHASETPIIIGSPGWTSRTGFADDYPFEGDNLIYSSHIYPANGLPSEFDSTYGEPAEDVPVVVTEFGWDPDGGDIDKGTNSGWGQPFRDWVESYENMGWIAWCFDDSWAPHMFYSPGGPGAGEPWYLKSGPEQHGGFIKQWLVETSEEPIARFHPSETATTVGELVTFGVEDVSGNDRWIESLDWTFGDGTTGSGWWTNHRYDSPGQYNVSLTATDNKGESTTHELALTVSELSEPIARANASTTEAIVGERITFESEDNPDDDRWVESLDWSFGDGTTDSGWQVDHQYDSSGEYTVTLTATGSLGHSTTDEQTITVTR